jgi:hypothetical protein
VGLALGRIPPWLRTTLIVVAAITVLAALPIIGNEMFCYSPRAADATGFRSALEPQYRREEINSYLTYPEWSIVHAYEDFAGVTRQGSESDFAYFSSVRRYWSSLCGITRMASSRGPVALDYKVMLYTIGLSFAAEMGTKGAYERSIGRITAWLRGPKRTAEDEFALTMADDYATFLRQTPWFEYPFASKLAQFWTQTPVSLRNPIRSLERRLSLTGEMAVKAVYAKLIGFGAGATPVPLTNRSVIKGLDPADIKAVEGIKLIGTREDGASVIETPRYRVFTGILQKLALRGRDAVEIAGNDDILVTLLAPEAASAQAIGGKELFSVPIQSKPGWRRFGLDVRIPELLGMIRRMRGSNIELEHVYDY